MIRFFRSIRRKLIEEGIVSKYIWYALGEILLVMIGILLALQVNNWNEERLSRLDENDLLRNVKTDMNEAIIEFERLNKIRISISEVVEDVLMVDTDPLKIYSKNELDSLFSILAYQPTYNNQSSSLEVLLSSGKINLLQDDSLKAMLLNWPGLVVDMTEGELNHSNFAENYYTPLIIKYISMNDIYSFFKLPANDSEFVPGFNRVLNFKSDYNSLFEDPGFENILIQRDFLLKIALLETEDLINKANDIIERIDGMN